MQEADVLKSEHTAVRTRRNALGCALLVGLCVLVTYPVLQMGTADEPSYMRTALEFARSGHIVYNGGATAILGWQVLWNASFIKLFGASFTALRFSTLPIAMGTVYLLYCILARFAVNPWNATLATLTVGLSPLFLVLTTSFMTDIPGFFCLLLCLYLCQHAVVANTTRSAILWLSLAALSSVVGGTDRQTAWLGALLLIPSTTWLLRRRRSLVLSGVLLWIGSVAAIYLCLRWYYRQPYALREPIVLSLPSAVQFHVFCFKVFLLLLSLVLLALPIFMAFISAVWRLPLRFGLACFGLTVLCIAAFPLLSLRNFMLAPWLGNYVTAGGMINTYDTLGPRPVILSAPVRFALFMLVIAAICSFLTVLFVTRPRENWIAPKHSLSWHQMLWLVLPFTLGYVGLLLPRALYSTTTSPMQIFDRYLPPIVASLLILLVRFYQEKVRIKLPSISVVMLTVFSLWGIAATHDLFSMDRARLAAAEKIHQAGVPRTQIQASFEYDFSTQLETAGHINDPRIRIPGDAYDPEPERLSGLPHRFEYSYLIPAVQPKYFLVFVPQSGLDPTPFPPIFFRTWLPPFGATIYVQQLPDK